MNKRARNAAWLCLLAGGGMLFSGCLARAQDNFDLLFGAGAVENALRLPYSSVFGLAQFLLRFG